MAQRTLTKLAAAEVARQINKCGPSLTGGRIQCGFDDRLPGRRLATRPLRAPPQMFVLVAAVAGS